MKEPQQPVTCIQCGQQFTPKRSLRVDPLCSSTCRSKRYSATHPGKSTEYTKKWRKNNPEKAAAIIKRSNNKLAGKRVKKSAIKSASIYNTRKPVMDMLRRGKDPIDVALYFRLPLSVIIKHQKAMIDEKKAKRKSPKPA